MILAIKNLGKGLHNSFFGAWTVYMNIITSDARYFVVETKCNCDLIIGFMANTYFILQMHHAKSFKMRCIKSVYKLF